MVRHLSLELYHNNESLESARAETVALQSEEEVHASVEEMLVSLVESNVCRGCGALLGTDAEEEGEVAMACGEEEEEGACFRGGMPSLELRGVEVGSGVWRRDGRLFQFDKLRFCSGVCTLL